MRTIIGRPPVPNANPFDGETFVGELFRSRDSRRELRSSMAVDRLTELSIFTTSVDAGGAARTPNASSFERLDSCRAVSKGEPRRNDDDGFAKPSFAIMPGSTTVLRLSKREGDVGDTAGEKFRLAVEGRGRVICL